MEDYMFYAPVELYVLLEIGLILFQVQVHVCGWN